MSFNELLFVDSKSEAHIPKNWLVHSLFLIAYLLSYLTVFLPVLRFPGLSSFLQRIHCVCLQTLLTDQVDAVCQTKEVVNIKKSSAIVKIDTLYLG